MLALSSIAAPAHADAILFLDDLNTAGIDVIIVDNVDGGVGSAGAGLITFSGVVGGFIWRRRRNA